MVRPHGAHPEWFRQYSHYEAVANAIRICHGQAIPGPLQTDDYLRGLLKAGRAKDIEAVLADRVGRKRAILDRSDPPTIWALMDESVLTMPVGGPAVMKEQLRHLLELSESPHIIVRVIPASAGPHLGVDGPFQVISLEARDVAYSGAQGGGRLIEEPGEVKEFTVKFDHIGAQAASVGDSRVLIESHLRRYA